MFPHDNYMDLMPELVWEVGHLRWVFHGTPGGGAGLQGCLEMGCSVVALCFDDFHEEQLQKFMLERAVESMVGGHSKVFKDESLMARSAELDLLPPSKAKGRTATALVETAEGTDDLTHPFFKKTKKAAEVKKKDGKKRKNKKKLDNKKKKTKAAESEDDGEDDDSPSSEDDSYEESAEKKPPAKKQKT